MSKVRGLEKLNRILNNLAFDMDKATDDAVRATAFAVQSNATKSLAKISIGKEYKRGENNVHIASKPGDSPNTDSGELASNIYVSHRAGDKVAYVYTTKDYGEHLEFGTEKIEPRPWLEPARDEESEKYSKRLEAALDKQMAKAGR